MFSSGEAAAIEIDLDRSWYSWMVARAKRKDTGGGTPRVTRHIQSPTGKSLRPVACSHFLRRRI